MRDSTKLLYDDLKDAGLMTIALRAAQEYYHDMFSALTDPMGTLYEDVRRTAMNGEGDREKAAVILNNIMEGKYDATNAESDEWAASAEGQAAFKSLSSEGVSNETLVNLFGEEARQPKGPKH